MDQYRVVGTDGKEFGPVDLAGLQQWVREGRVLKDTRIRKNDGAAIMAELLPELAATFTPPPAGSTVPPIGMTVLLPGEFRIWGFIDQAWQLVKPHWMPLGVMFLITSLIGAIPYLGGCVMLILGQTLYVGINRAILGMLAGRTPTIEMMFGGFDRFGQAFAAGLVCTILVCIGLVCLIVPGIILAIMWMFTSLVIAETDQDFWTAMQTSANLTKGYRWPLFGLALASILVAILGLLACCIGIVVAEAVIFTAIALAYRFLQARNGAAKTA
jgi:uncharacterized membrane protein